MTRMTGYRANSNYEVQGGKLWVVNGGIDLNGVIKFKPVNVGDDLILTSDNSGHVVISSTLGAIVNLPSAEEGLYFSLTNIGVGDATIETFGSQTIHGDSNFTLYTDENISLCANNSNWYLI
jgi:hypothetical protein